MGWVELTTSNGETILVNMDNMGSVSTINDPQKKKISARILSGHSSKAYYVRETVQQIKELIEEEDRRMAIEWHDAAEISWGKLDA